jgi:hypothetical protein
VPPFETPFAPAPRQLPLETLHEIAIRFAGTASTCVPVGRLPPYGCSSCFMVDAGPWIFLWTVTVFVLPLTFVVAVFVLNR